MLVRLQYREAFGLSAEQMDKEPVDEVIFWNYYKRFQHEREEKDAWRNKR